MLDFAVKVWISVIPYSNWNFELLRQLLRIGANGDTCWARLECTMLGCKDYMIEMTHCWRGGVVCGREAKIAGLGKKVAIYLLTEAPRTGQAVGSNLSIFLAVSFVWGSSVNYVVTHTLRFGRRPTPVDVSTAWRERVEAADMEGRSIWTFFFSFLWVFFTYIYIYINKAFLLWTSGCLFSYVGAISLLNNNPLSFGTQNELKREEILLKSNRLRDK